MTKETSSKKSPKAAPAPKEPVSTQEKAKKINRKRRNVPEGRVTIQAGFNNTLVSVTDPTGGVLAWSSAGASGFKGSKKSTPYAAQIAAENASEKAKAFGMAKVHVAVKVSDFDLACKILTDKGIELEEPKVKHFVLENNGGAAEIIKQIRKLIK